MFILDAFTQVQAHPEIAKSFDFACVFAVSALVVCACLWAGVVLGDRAERLAASAASGGYAPLAFPRILCGVLGLAVSVSMLLSLSTTGISPHPATSIGCAGCAMLCLITISSAVVRPQAQRAIAEAEQDATTYAFPQTTAQQSSPRDRRAA
jgi:formate-dependent nitrite reductase membrane component NrfD